MVVVAIAFNRHINGQLLEHHCSNGCGHFSVVRFEQKGERSEKDINSRLYGDEREMKMVGNNRIQSERVDWMDG